MGYSIEDYLKRRTDDELKALLEMYLPQMDNEYYADLVAMIRKILQERCGGKE